MTEQIVLPRPRDYRDACQTIRNLAFIAQFVIDQRLSAEEAQSLFKAIAEGAYSNFYSVEAVRHSRRGWPQSSS